jgi:hypothetical protein
VGGSGLGKPLITFGAPLALIVSIIGCIMRARRQRACKYSKYRAVGIDDAGEDAAE